ncbi:MAG: DNA polymerase I [Bryobacterales bacterium]|nr:DNA polymerase I [Bryobacterales bacterium]
MARPRLFLIDTYGYLFRAFHARARSAAPPMRTSKGLPTEVVFIFNNMLKKLCTTHKPDYLAAIFESLGPTIREQEFADYKANREATPPEFSQQVPYAVRLLEAMRIPILQYDGYEADDVIGTLSCSALRHGVDVVIVSSDKDLLQLVNDRVSMVNPAKNDEWYNPAKVEEFMGVPPANIADLLALMGDAVDNIPGAPGIGEKGARDIVKQFGSVEAALDRAAEVQRKMYRESLQNNRAQIELSKRLATVTTNLPLEWSLDALAVKPYDPDALRQLYTEMEFHSQVKDLKADAPAVEWKLTPIESAEDLREWLQRVEDGLAITMPPRECDELVETTRVGLAAREAEGISIPTSLLPELKSILEDASRPKVVHDAKSVSLALAAQYIRLEGLRDDPMLYEFLLSADPGSCSLDVLTTKHLDRKVGLATEEAAATVWMLGHRLSKAVDERKLRKLYEEIDLPLVGVLTRMEQDGIRIDPAALQLLSGRMDADIQRLSTQIYDLAGHPFNINSPPQLGIVLFEELKLPMPAIGGRTAKTKNYSTAADVLEALAGEHEICRLVLEYRQLAKLKGTYVDALPALINKDTGRVHTTFNPAGAATGRLSSSNPNLQNIPIRTELGREIRAAFVPREGWRMVVADYSQIELRLLAHYSRDPVLVESFIQREDIHTRTAAEVFGVMPLMVSREMRNSAKAVNFGIVYGISAFGLAQQLGIPRLEAERYIKAYFERYAGVRKFINETIAEVRQSGVTKTLFGRERPIPDMNARNPNARGFAERTAVNTPLQGTAADLIKLAMIAIDKRLRAEKWQSKMLLQVHDELVFESPENEVTRLSEMVHQEMEGVTKLAVPLVAEVGSGPNWRDAK